MLVYIDSIGRRRCFNRIHPSHRGPDVVCYKPSRPDWGGTPWTTIVPTVYGPMGPKGELYPAGYLLMGTGAHGWFLVCPD
jgi:hypothetical protein